MLAGSRRLLGMLIDAFAPEAPLIMTLDDTIERRRGAKIAAKGIYRDPVRSSHGHFVKASILRWLCLMLVARSRGPSDAGRCRPAQCWRHPSTITRTEANVRTS